MYGRIFTLYVIDMIVLFDIGSRIILSLEKFLIVGGFDCTFIFTNSLNILQMSTPIFI